MREQLLPERNRKDVDEDVPEQVKADMTIHFVSEIGQVLGLALEGGPGSAAAVEDGKGERKAPSRRRKPETVAA